MQALVFTKAEKSLELKEVPKPVISKPTDVIVKISNCGVCGTDCHIFHGDISNVGDVFVPGHEAGGIVTEVGSGVTAVKVGDKVAIDPNKGCHGCNHCRNANPHFCKKGSFNDAFGIFRNGGFADFAVAPEESLYLVPDDFDMSHMSLIEPLSCVVHGWRKLTAGRHLQTGARILVQGAGIIGSLWTCLMHFKGYRHVTVSEPSAERRGFIDGLQLGFKTTEPKGVESEYDVVIDCSGAPRAIQDGINRVAHGGIFLQFGVAPSTATCEIRPFHIYEREITIQGVMVNPWAFPEAIELTNQLRARYLDFGKLGIGKFSLGEYKDCFEKLSSGKISKASFVFE
ncbi:Oidioi.mRNA.OKI2018_I69.PAR.g9949.t1.cds [Oikopleura dioica]|uniref:Oidioi.mRNA.OKI2018_I69.PAR.g9949.t1.cds n=1 Tax=Oikopleura dioica TaxID=34765 RepID=A0ABN7RRN8_OIKDI|nr:Oidioi.mRNA.OKI2018_I69.PAR.g9949.t1.cds [Oikopleura dioica]